MNQMLIAAGQSICLTNRPFQGLGAKVYGGLGSPDAIVYRPPRVFAGSQLPMNPSTSNDASLGSVNSPTNAITFTAPSSWWGRSDIWLQVRTFGSDLENETVYQPRQISLDSSGNLLALIAGTYRLLSVDPPVVGVSAIRFSWVPDLSCVALTSFAAVMVTGPSSVATQLGSVLPERIQSIPLSGLVAGTYVFRVEARSASTSSVLDASVSVVVPAAPASTISLAITEK